MRIPIDTIVLCTFLVTAVVGITDTLVGITTCLPGSPLTAFPQCDYFVNATNVCGNLGQQQRLTCLCNQPLFDSIFGCESEYRLCFESTDIDNTLEQAAISWHAFCGSYITFSPTTPPVSALITTYVDDFCFVARSACELAQASFDKCSTLVSNSASLSSCTCQPNILRWDYTCEYLGNVSCLATGATISSLLGYSMCDNFMQVIEGAMSSTNIITVTLPSSTSTPNPSPGGTVPTSSTPTPTSTPTPASTTAKASASKVMLGPMTWALYFILIAFAVAN